MAKVEALVRWSELKFNNTDSEEAYLSKLIDGEEIKNKAQIFYEYSPMVFDTNDVVRFNRSNDSEHTTLRFKDGDGYVIKFPYREFIDFYIDAQHTTVTSLLPEEYLSEELKHEEEKDIDEDEDLSEDDDLGI